MVQAIAAYTENSPRPAANPANGRMTSLGMGGKTFSSATMIPAPGAPKEAISSCAHPASPPPPDAGAAAYMIVQRPPTSVGFPVRL